MVQDALIRTLALTLLHFLWQGVLIGACAAVALRYSSTRTARQRHFICLLALLACLVVPAITAIVVHAESIVQSAPKLPLTAGAITPASPGMALPVRGGGGSEQSVNMMSLGVGLWLLGALSVATYYAVQWLGVARLRRSAFPLRGPKPLASATARILQQWTPAGRASVMLSHLVATPVVIGLWRPLVIFPAATIARMSSADFELILLHEVAHIVRRDTWANALQVSLEILLFYHPVVHWLSRRARLERECACDDFVVNASGSAYRYAQTLTSLALSRDRPAAMLSLGAAGGELLPRLRNLAGESVDGEAFPRSPVQLLVLALLLLSLTSMRAPLGSWWPWSAPAYVEPRSDEASDRELRLHDPIPMEPIPALESFINTVESLELQQPIQHAQRMAKQQEQEARDTRVTRPAREARRAREAVASVTGAAADIAHAEAHEGELTPPTAEGLATAAVVSPAEAAPPKNAATTPLAQHADNTLDAATPPAVGSSPPARVAARGLTLSYSPLPEYPVRARLDGIEGTVVAVVQVGNDGRPASLRIVSATPLGVFEGAVRRALLRWRYDVPQTIGSENELTVGYRLDFSISGVSSMATGLCATATASRTCSPP